MFARRNPRWVQLRNAALIRNGGVGAVLGPTTNSRIAKAATVADTDAATRVNTQSITPRALNRCGLAEPSARGPNQRPNHQTHIATRPASRQLHSHRVNSGHANPGRKSQGDHRPGRRLKGQNQQIGGSRQQRRSQKEASRFDPVRQIEQSADQGSDDEPGLNRAGEKRRDQRRQADAIAQGRHHGRRGEPQRHGRHGTKSDDQE